MNESGKNAGYLAFGLLGVWFWADVSVWWFAGGLVLVAAGILIFAYNKDRNEKSPSIAQPTIQTTKSDNAVSQTRLRTIGIEAEEQVLREQLYGTEAQQNADYEIGNLHKQATMLAEAGDMLAAVYSLQTAQNMTLEASYSYSPLHFTRLPLFMQKAGLYSEALAEVERLAVFFKSYVARCFSHQPAKRIEELYQGYLADLYDKARLLAKRQKDLEKSKEFALRAVDALKLSKRDQL
jgi:hypothetical protein